MGGDYILALLFEIGPVMAGGMGATELSSTEIGAWQSGTGVALEGWEFSLIRELSRLYVHSINRYNNSTERAPDISDAEHSAALKRHMSAAGKF